MSPRGISPPPSDRTHSPYVDRAPTPAPDSSYDDDDSYGILTHVSVMTSTGCIVVDQQEVYTHVFHRLEEEKVCVFGYLGCINDYFSLLIRNIWLVLLQSTFAVLQCTE